MNRRQLITGLISLVAAPAIIRVASLMPVKVMMPQNCIGGSLNAEDVTKYYAHIKTYMDAMGVNGVWNKLDMLYVFDAPTEELATTNWKKVMVSCTF